MIVDYDKIIVDCNVLIVDCNVSIVDCKLIVDCKVIIVDWDDEWRWVNCATSQLQQRPVQYNPSSHLRFDAEKICCNWILKVEMLSISEINSTINL